MPEAIRQGDIPGVQLRCRRRLPLTCGQAWEWLAEERRLARWLADAARRSPGPDGPLRLERRAADRSPIVEEGLTLALEPPHRWVLELRRSGWPAPTRLTFELEPAPGGCEISVLEQGFEHQPLSDCLTLWEAARRRWRSALERLEAEVGSEQ